MSALIPSSVPSPSAAQPGPGGSHAASLSAASPDGQAQARRRGPRRLAVRFWLGFVLPWALMSLLAGLLASWVDVVGDQLQPACQALLLSWFLLWVALVWGGVATWRAADVDAEADARQPGSGLFPLAARVVVVLALFATLAMSFFGLWPQAQDWWSLARGIDPLGSAQVRVSPDARRVLLQGPLSQGTADLLAAAWAQAPGAYVLEIDTPGGRLAEAQAIARQLQARPRQTRVLGRCGNACVLVFLAGRGRQIMPQASLSLWHQGSGGMVNPLFDVLALRWQAALWARAGLPASAIVGGLASSPAHPWVLQADELMAAGIIGVPERPLDVDLPPPQGALRADYSDALTGSPAWRGFEAYRAGTIALAADAMLQASQAGDGEAATQVAAQRVIEALLPGLLRDAGPELREQYLGLLQRQLQASRAAGPAACRAVLAGDAAARRALPAPWPERELSWLLDAATVSTPSQPRPLTALESEVLRRALGERAPRLLGSIRRPQPGDAESDTCGLGPALLAEVMQLPAPERRLAIRLMFDPA